MGLGALAGALAFFALGLPHPTVTPAQAPVAIIPSAIPATVASIEYDPNRSARLCLLFYRDGEKRSILCPQRVKVGDVLQSGGAAEVRECNAIQLRAMPRGSVEHNVQRKTGPSGRVCRSAGVQQKPVEAGVCRSCCSVTGVGRWGSGT